MGHCTDILQFSSISLWMVLQRNLEVYHDEIVGNEAGRKLLSSLRCYLLFFDTTATLCLWLAFSGNRQRSI